MFFAVDVDQDLLTLGGEVRRLRKAAGLSQEDLAGLSGLHVNYIGGIERGERNVGIKAFIRIAEGLRVHPANLFAGFGPVIAPHYETAAEKPIRETGFRS